MMSDARVEASCNKCDDDRDGADERMCNKCLNKIYDENHHSSVYHGVDNIQNEEHYCEFCSQEDE